MASTICYGLLVVFFCSAGPAAITTSEFCQVSKIIRLDRAEIDHMTQDSKRQIAAHNKKYHELCDPKVKQN